VENFKVGDEVRYLGPTELLFEGDIYYVERVEIHERHTRLYLRGIRGKFNSVCFEKV
jgi:hypothetical protein